MTVEPRLVKGGYLDLLEGLGALEGKEG